MSGWVYVGTVVGLLVAFGAIVNWRRRGSTGGAKDGDSPSEACGEVVASKNFNYGGRS